MRRILAVVTRTPFATGRTAAGRGLTGVVLGTTVASAGSYGERVRT